MKRLRPDKAVMPLILHAVTDVRAYLSSIERDRSPPKSRSLFPFHTGHLSDLPRML